MCHIGPPLHTIPPTHTHTNPTKKNTNAEGRSKPTNKLNGQLPKENTNNTKPKPIFDAFADDDDHDDDTVTSVAAPTINDNANNRLQNGKTAWNNNNNDVENRNQKNASITPTLEAIDNNGNAESPITIKATSAPTTDAFGNFEFPNENDFFADFNSTFQQKSKQVVDDALDAFGLGLNVNATKIEAAFGGDAAGGDRCLGNLSHKSAFSTNYTALTNDTHTWNNGNNNFTDDRFDDKFGSLITNTTVAANTITSTTPTPANDINMNPGKVPSTKSFGFDDNETGFADFDNAFDAFKTTSTTTSNVTPTTAVPPHSRIAAVFPTKHSNTTATVKPVAIGTSGGASVDAVDSTGDRLKVSKKFVNDYSRTDDFDNDLELVLQRSLVDQ